MGFNQEEMDRGRRQKEEKEVREGGREGVFTLTFGPVDLRSLCWNLVRITTIVFTTTDIQNEIQSSWNCESTKMKL